MGKFCTLCQVMVSNESGWISHVNGKKHAFALRNQQYREGLQQRSLFVSGFEKGTTQFQIGEYFTRFGKIERVNLNPNNGFAFVEFHDPVNVSQILSQRHFLGKKRLFVKPRRTNASPKKNRQPDEVKSENTVNELTQNELQQHENLMRCLKSSDSVNHQMDLVQECLQMTEEERKARFFVCKDLACYLQDFFENFELNLFGSSMTRLGFHNCDIDMVLTLFPEGMKPLSGPAGPVPRPNILKEIVNKENRKIRLEDLGTATTMNILACIRMLLQRSEKCKNLLTIPAKTAPLIRFKTAANLTCDLSIKNKIAVYNTKLIRFYLDFDQRVLPIILSIKYWIKCHELGGSGNQRLTSYAVTMMVIFFLQNTQPPVLPTVESLQNLRTQPVVIDGWQCNFSDDIYYCSENNQHRVDLLEQFYTFYSDFDFSEHVISPYNGKSVLRKHITDFFPDFKLTTISVQDPFELNRNITSNVTNRMAAKILLTLQQTKGLMTSDKFDLRDETTHWGLAQIFDRDSVTAVAVVPKLKLTEGKDSEKFSFSIAFSQGPILLQSKPDALEGDKIIEKMYEAVILTLRKGLQFECIRLEDESPPDENENSPSKRKLGEEEFKSKKALSNEGVALSKKTDGKDADCEIVSVGESQKFLCTIRYRTWMRRKKMRQMLATRLPLRVIPAEEKISKFLIEEEKQRGNDSVPCSGSFVCKLSPYPKPKQSTINVDVTPLDNSAELKSVLFQFLPSYLPKIVDRYLLEGN